MHSGLSCLLQHRHPVTVLVGVPAALLLVQLLPNVPGKATNDGPRACAPATWEIQVEFLGCYNHLGSEPDNGRSLLLSPCPLLSLPDALTFK